MGVRPNNQNKKHCWPLGGGWKNITKEEADNRFFEYYHDYDPKRLGIGGIIGGERNSYYVIDIDNPLLFEEYIRNSPHRDTINDLIKNTPIQRSHSGNFHIFLKTNESGLRARKLPYGDLKANGSIIFLDCTIHPVVKTPYSFDKPFFEPFCFTDDSIFGYVPSIEKPKKERISRKVFTHVPIPVSTEKEICFKSLPLKYQSILEGNPNEEARSKYKGDRSNAEQAIIMYCVKEGYPFEAILQLFELYAKPGTKCFDKGNKRENFLRFSYENAARAYSPEGTDSRLELLENISLKASGVKGREATLFAVLCSIKEIAKKAGRTQD